jgi:hypothetical protein
MAMGPILIFDKSALQSLSLDESVWLENFFLNNITPLFYVETLADLALAKTSDGRPAEIIIGELANRAPDQGMFPNVHHQRLVEGDLLGYKTEMSGRPIIKGGVPKISPDGKLGMHYSQSPESEALNRWNKKQFLEVEREFAKDWRQSLSDLNYNWILGITKNVVPADMRLSSLSDIKKFVDQFVTNKNKAVFDLALDFLGVNPRVRPFVVERWNKEDQPPFSIFAPYASFVFRVDLFFYICLLRGFESKDRPSHKIDLAYLYYLPFCNVFVSSDKLHGRIASLFMEQGQTFIKGDVFKADLKNLDDHYLKHTEEIEKVGIMKYAIYPPTDLESEVARLWDKYCIYWRKHLSERKAGITDLPKDAELVKHLNKVQEESTPIDPKTPITSDETDHVIFSRMVPIRKGKWRILPPEVENAAKK